eukprot:TRINITY_DN407_c0_g2_i2.p2 TRINITY_DN407_c0_g2~~TRINITY_DN407_c0_g2_i2.p2  ORF type:complete len:162 (+),score=19.53 TRINITY_DN407_c0_g2_i2:130-615(+)
MAEGTKVYCGNLSTINICEQRDLEDVFGKFGAVRNVWIARNPPGFAFVTFEDPRDAEDAVRELDGKELDREKLTEDGQRIRVEVSHGRGKGSGGGRGGGYDRDRDDRGYGGRDRYDDRRGRSPDRYDDRRGRSRSRSRGRDRDDRRRGSPSPRRSRSRSRD